MIYAHGASFTCRLTATSITLVIDNYSLLRLLRLRQLTEVINSLDYRPFFLSSSLKLSRVIRTASVTSTNFCGSTSLATHS